MGTNSTSSDLRDFFLSLTRTSFHQLGVGDRQIIDYVASLLTEFSRSDRWLQLRDAEGRGLSSVVDMLLVQLGPEGQRRVLGERAVRKYVGDYTLFMSGLFRSYVERGGYLDYYLEEGKRSYQQVSRLDVSLYRPGFLVFQQLSDDFECYSGALDYMRKCFFAQPAPVNPFSGISRQLHSLLPRARTDN